MNFFAQERIVGVIITGGSANRCSKWVRASKVECGNIQKNYESQQYEVVKVHPWPAHD
jgi:hypothetical protein